jgi:hypothetical protein
MFYLVYLYIVRRLNIHFNCSSSEYGNFFVCSPTHISRAKQCFPGMQKPAAGKPPAHTSGFQKSLVTILCIYLYVRLMISDVPTKGIKTLYGSIGDLFAYSNIALTLFFLGFGLLSKRQIAA